MQVYLFSGKLLLTFFIQRLQTFFFIFVTFFTFFNVFYFEWNVFSSMMSVELRGCCNSLVLEKRSCLLVCIQTIRCSGRTGVRLSG